MVVYFNNNLAILAFVKILLIKTKMVKIIIFFLVSLLIIGCATLKKYEYKYGSTVQIRTDFLERNDGNIEYKSPKSILEELNERSKLEMWSKSKFNKYKNATLTAGGYIIARTSGITLGSAKLKYWNCIVMKMNGDKIDYTVSKKNNSIPNVPSDSSGKWWDLFLVYINEPITEPFKVYLISKIHKKRNEYVIYPNEKVSSSNF